MSVLTQTVLHLVLPCLALRCTVPADTNIMTAPSIDAKVVLPLVKTHASIIAGSAPNAAMTFTGIPSDSRSTLTNVE